MSILTAIFQAIGQALTWVLPVSESGHSSIFHDFSARFTGTHSELTGLIHIGIAIGTVIVFYKLFLRLTVHFFGGWNDLFHKRLSVKKAVPMRKFMFLSILSFVPMLLYIIPAGKYGDFLGMMRSLSFNGTLIDESIGFILIGVFVFFANKLIKNEVNNKSLDLLSAVIIGFALMFSVALSGLSPFAVVFCLAVLLGAPKKVGLRYAAALSAPAVLVTGIIEICTCVTYVNIVSGILAVVISIISTYVTLKVFIYLVHNAKIGMFAYYDFGIGVICFFIGVIELLSK